MRRILVAGGAGFIGANFVRHHAGSCPEDELVCLDALTYAGSRDNLAGLFDRIEFHEGDVRDPEAVRAALRGVDHVVNFAAETHVDRSIVDGADFLSTNVAGTHVLLTAAREAKVERFVQIGTDEVYGSLQAPARASEEFPLRPRNPYSASKAAADQLALAHFHTYETPVCVTRCGNNFGPYQLPEKLLPLAILRALEGRPIPVYGDGLQVREWIHVEDHCRALEAVLDRGRPGEIYNVSGGEGRTNRDVLNALLALLDAPLSLLQEVEDRPGHDRRYALDARKIERELGVRPEIPFLEGLKTTVDFYRGHEEWCRAAQARIENHRQHWLQEQA